MTLTQFESEEPERMTPEERRAVIARWQSERGFAPSDEATLPDVAEGLNISVSEASCLLTEIRAERAEAEHQLHKERARLLEAQQMLRHLEQSLQETERQRISARQLRESEQRRQENFQQKQQSLQKQREARNSKFD